MSERKEKEKKKSFVIINNQRTQQVIYLLTLFLFQSKENVCHTIKTNKQRNKIYIYKRFTV